MEAFRPTKNGGDCSFCFAGFSFQRTNKMLWNWKILKPNNSAAMLGAVNSVMQAHLQHSSSYVCRLIFYVIFTARGKTWKLHN